MKVAFNVRLLAAPTLRGWNRYTVNLLSELAQFGTQLFLYSDRPIHSSHLARLPAEATRVRCSGPMQYFWWEQYWLPRQCRLDDVDILHVPFHFGLPWSTHCPRVITLHDTIGFEPEDRNAFWRSLPSGQLGLIANRLDHWIARNRAHHVITLTEYSRLQLQKTFGFQPENISVTHEAADPRFLWPVPDPDRARIRQTYGIEVPYFLYVGGWEKRKNVPFLVRAFAGAQCKDVSLVLAGGRKGERAGLINFASELGVVKNIKLLDWVEDSDLPALFAEALAFVYPSRREGFGLQLCEAMAVGCPVLAARSTSLPEVLADGGELFGLESITELVALLQKVASDAEFRADMIRRGFARSEYFSWRRTAECTLDVYRKLTR